MPRNHVLAKASSSLGASSKIYKNHPRALRLTYHIGDFFWSILYFHLSFHPWVPGVNFLIPPGGGRRSSQWGWTEGRRGAWSAEHRCFFFGVVESNGFKWLKWQFPTKRADVFLKIKSEVPRFCHVEHLLFQRWALTKISVDIFLSTKFPSARVSSPFPGGQWPRCLRSSCQGICWCCSRQGTLQGISPSFNPHHLAQHPELTFGTFWTQSKFIQLILIDK